MKIDQNPSTPIICAIKFHQNPSKSIIWSIKIHRSKSIKIHHLIDQNRSKSMKIDEKSRGLQVSSGIQTLALRVSTHPTAERQRDSHALSTRHQKIRSMFRSADRRCFPNVSFHRFSSIFIDFIDFGEGK